MDILLIILLGFILSISGFLLIERGNAKLSFFCLFVSFCLFVWITSLFFVEFELHSNVRTNIEWAGNSQVIYDDGEEININKELGVVIQPNECIEVIKYKETYNGIYLGLPSQYRIINR